MSKVAMLELAKIGSGMALSLARAGHSVVVWNAWTASHGVGASAPTVAAAVTFVRAVASKYKDPATIICPKCAARSFHRVADLLALKAVCPSCAAPLVEAGVASSQTLFFPWSVALVSSAWAPSALNVNRSPGWHPSCRQIASRVENRIAFALPVLRIDRLARVMPTRSASSVNVMRRA